MPVPSWFLWYLPVILLANLLFVWYVIQRSDVKRENDDDGPGRGTVRCPECSNENEARFQFCRSCLTELPS